MGAPQVDERADHWVGKMAGPLEVELVYRMVAQMGFHWAASSANKLVAWKDLSTEFQ